MAGGFSAKRYAAAVFEIARERDELDRWQGELDAVIQLRRDAALAAWLDNPKVGLDLKREYLEAALGRVSPLGRNLVYLLITRGRLGAIAEIAAAYAARLNEHRGLVPARVTTAASLDQATEDSLKARLREITGRDVLLSTEVDPAVLGGFVARIGDKLLDGSTRSRLKALRKNIAEG